MPFGLLCYLVAESYYIHRQIIVEIKEERRRRVSSELICSQIELQVQLQERRAIGLDARTEQQYISLYIRSKSNFVAYSKAE